MAVLEHLKALVGKGGEGGESPTEPRGEQQAHGMRDAAMASKQTVYHSDEQAPQQVYRQRAPGEGRGARPLHQRGNQEPQRTAQETPRPNYQNGLQHSITSVSCRRKRHSLPFRRAYSSRVRPYHSKGA